MTDRYSVDALAPQYDEIAGICMMGKPVILTRDNQELVLMNPVEFRKMMQLVSRIQETNKEKEMAVEHAGKLERELERVQEDLARSKRELAKVEEDLAAARKELDEARVAAEAAGTSETTEAAGAAETAESRGSDAFRIAEAGDLAGDNAGLANRPADRFTPYPVPVQDNDNNVTPGAPEGTAGQALVPVQAAQEIPDVQTIQEVQMVQDAAPGLQTAAEEEGQGQVMQTADYQDAPVLAAEAAAAETDSGIIEASEADMADSAGANLQPIPAMPDLPAGDRKARFLKAVASSLEKRASMVMEPVPEGLAIDVEALTKKYSGVTANSKLSLHVPYGAVYALLGLNGSGRSTLVKNLLGLTFPNSGRIALCNASGKELNDIRELTGSVMDVPVLYEHMSINQNMVYRAKLLRLKTPKPAIKEALKRFGLFDKKRKKVRTLSSGAKQKLALALAILGNPELLILDEPLKGLDAADIAVFCDVMMDMNAKGSTILITDCRTDGIAGIATHYGILQDGQLIREVSARQLLEDPVDLDMDYLAAGEV